MAVASCSSMFDGDQRAARIDPHDLAIALELPRRQHAAREAMADAGVVQQLARMLGRAVHRQIGGRGACGEALPPRADRHRDHVLLQPLAIAHPGIETGREHIDEGVLRRHLQRDAGVRLEETLHQPRQHHARDDDRHIEPERAGRAVAKAVHRVERGGDFAERRQQPVEQARAGLGQRHAARGAVEQAHAEPLLQPAHRLAQASRARRRAGSPRRGSCDGGRRPRRRRDRRGQASSIVRYSVQPVLFTTDYRTKPHVA